MSLKPQSLLAVGTEYVMANWANEAGSQVIAIYRDLTKDGIANYMMSQPPRGDFRTNSAEFKMQAYSLTFDLMDRLNNPDQGLKYMTQKWEENGGKVYIQ